jgi:integrase
LRLSEVDVDLVDIEGHVVARISVSFCEWMSRPVLCSLDRLRLVSSRTKEGGSMKKPTTYKTRGNVFKRCDCGSSTWDLCAHPWYFKLQVNGRKERGKLPAEVTTKAAARVAVQDIEDRMKDGRDPFPVVDAGASTTVTVVALSKDWLSLDRGRQKSTRGFYRDILSAHVLPVFGERMANTITYRELESFVGKLDASTGTKRKVARTIRTMFGWAVSPSRILEENPADGLLRAFKDAESAEEEAPIDPSDTSKYFPKEEATKLLDTAEKEMPEFFPLVFVAVSLGLRKGEIKALRYDRIDWTGSYVTVERNIVRGDLTSPKTKKIRTVSMSENLAEVLRHRWTTAGKPADALVFPTRVNTSLSDSVIFEKWRKLLKLSKMAYRPLLACRHTHTSLLLQAGVPVAIVAAEAGRTIAVTERVYAHFIKGGAKKEAETLANVLGRASEEKSPKPGLSRQRTATKRSKRSRSDLRLVG